MRQVLAGLTLFLGATFAVAQSAPVPADSSQAVLSDSSETHTRDEVWRPITTEAGVEISYLFYEEGNGANDGVVVRLVNTNDHSVTYRFQMLFKAGERREEASVSTGTLAAGELRTGSMSDLWWVPFEAGETITEVGMRGLRVERVAI